MRTTFVHAIGGVVKTCQAPHMGMKTHGGQRVPRCVQLAEWGIYAPALAFEGLAVPYDL